MSTEFKLLFMVTTTIKLMEENMLIIPRHKFEFAKFNSLEEKVNQTYNLTGKIIKKTSIKTWFRV